MSDVRCWLPCILAIGVYEPYTVLRKKLRETPPHGGVSILGQECALSAHLVQERGRQHIDVSSKPIDAHAAKLCENSGEGGAARIDVVEIEVERLLFCGKQHHPKTLVIEFLDDEHRP